MKINIFIALLLTFISCKDNQEVIPVKGEEPEEVIDNDPPGNFAIRLVSVTDSSAVLSWSKPIDPNNDTLYYSVNLNGKIVKTDLTDSLYVFQSSLVPSTEYKVGITAFDGKDSSKAEISFNTTILTFLKLYDLGTEGGGILKLDNGFLLYGRSHDGASNYNPYVMEVDKLGNIIWRNNIESGVCSDLRINSVSKTDNEYILSMTSWETEGNGGSYMRWDYLSFSGNTLKSKQMFFKRTRISTNHLYNISNNLIGSFYGFNPSTSANETYLYKLDNLESFAVIGNLGDHEISQDVILGPNGSLYIGIAESVNGGVNGLAKLDDSFLDDSFNIAWKKSFKVKEGYYCYEIAHNEVNIFSIGSTFTEPFNIIGMVVKTNLEGDVSWKRIIDAGSYETLLQAVSPTKDGGCIVAGNISGRYTDGYFGLFKISSDGVIEWEKKFSLYQDLNSITVNGVVENQDGGYYMYGTVRDSWRPERHYQFLIKLDENGNP